jgi:hypothetical protein
MEPFRFEISAQGQEAKGWGWKSKRFHTHALHLHKAPYIFLKS